MQGHAVRMPGHPKEPAPSLQLPQGVCPLGESRARHQKSPARLGEEVEEACPLCLLLMQSYQLTYG